MKKSKIVSIISISALSFALLGVLFFNQEVKEVEAYSTSSLPTTINLNDVEDADIRSYYSSLSSLSAEERQGENLLKNLKTILKNGQKYYSYDSGNSIWQIYEITDRDWEKSPASLTTYGTYNSSTNTITNYQYGSSSNHKNDPYVHALYINRNVENETKAWGNHNQDRWGINREHVWPKAEGFDDDKNSSGGARGDPMHLMAGNGYSNNIHSNYYYGYVDTSSSYTDCGSKFSNQSGNLRGKPLNVSSSGTVFEPQDSDKGDIARAIFYMVARYNYLSGSDSDGINADNPNLTLTNNLSDWSSTGYTSSKTKQGKLGLLKDLLAWHHADPVDEYEIHRNNLLYRNYTNNRNPFIDFPEWADYIWGTVNYNGRQFVSENSTPTNYVDLNNDVLYGYRGEDSNPRINSVSLYPTSAKLYLEGNNSVTLTPTVSAANGASTSVTWESSNTSVATISNEGVVTAVSKGSTTITVTSTFDNTKSATCVIDVFEGDGSEGIITATNGKLDGWEHHNIGDGYGDGSVKLDATGDYVENVSLFTGNISNYMTSLTVTINCKHNSGSTGDPAYNSYKVEALNFEGEVLAEASYTGTIAGSYNNKVFSFDSNLYGCAGIRFTYSNKSSGNLGVKSISWTSTHGNPSIVANTTKSFKVGDVITKSDIVVRDLSSNIITDYTFEDNGYRFTYEDAPSGGSLGNKSFDITCGDLSTVLTVDVYREEYSEEYQTITDVLTRSVTDVSGTTYTSWSGKTSNSGAVYSGQSAGGNNSIQLRSGTSSGDVHSGIVTTKSGGFVSSIVVSWNSNTKNGRKLDVYGANSPYSSADDLYVSSSQGTLLGSIVNGTSTSISITGKYRFIGLRSNDGAMYLDSISIIYAYESAENVANYIMFEDTENQCVSKFEIATNYFNDMSVSERTTFMTSNDYVIKTARERLEAWATNQGKSIKYIDNDYQIANGLYLYTDLVIASKENEPIILVLVISLLTFISFGTYAYIRKNKAQ